jgi:hypothetical protein
VRKKSGATFIVLAVVIVAGLGVWRWKAQQASSPAPVATPTGTQTSGNAPAADSPTTKQDFQKLRGKWLRPDGGYVIDIKSVAEDGAMDAAYFNPRPIHVAKADASHDGATTKLFIELRDVNYPGSTYTLAYDSEGDRLYGNYFQAVEQQNFDVVFVRTK